MEYLYAAMLLHKAGKEITKEAVTNIIKAAGIEPDDAKANALVAALKDVDIDEAISKAVVQQPQAQPEAKAEQAKTEKKETPKKEEKARNEEAAAGLGALFG